MSKKPPSPLDQIEQQLQRRIASARPASPAAPSPWPANVIAWALRYPVFALALAWRAFLAAMYGLLLDPMEQEALQRVCGFRRPSTAGYREGQVVGGRRSGKSAIAATVGLYEAVVLGPEHMRHVAAAHAYVVIISRTQKQAVETLRYARSIVERYPELLAELEGEPLESQSGGELRFRNGVILTVLPASKASVRGFTILAAILDEAAWFGIDEESADQDEEIASAVRGGMLAPLAAPTRRLITISSPAAKAGMVYDQHQRYHGRPDSPVLCAQGPTWEWNPTIIEAQLEPERLRDPRRFAREYRAEFADAIAAWADGQVIDACTEGRDATPLPPIAGVTYFGAIDFATKHDSAVASFGHLEGDGAEARLVVDAIDRLTPSPGAPLDSLTIVRRFSELCHAYRVKKIYADQFSIGPLSALFKQQGIEVAEETATNISKLTHFGALRERIYARRISLPRHDAALRELRQLEEKISASGHVQIGAPNRSGAHDDCAASLAWLCAACATAAPSNAQLLRRVYAGAAHSDPFVEALLAQTRTARRF